MNKAILCAALALLFCWALPVQAKENKTLKIVYVEWDCATASSNLAKAVLEDRLGYKVELLPVTQPILWTSLASGDADAMVTAWLPDTHKEMYAKVKNQVEMLGKLTGGARLGLAVPDYVPLKSVEELSANAAKFKNRIIGIDPGAGIMQLTEKLLKHQKYGIGGRQRHHHDLQPGGRHPQQGMDRGHGLVAALDVRSLAAPLPGRSQSQPGQGRGHL